MIILKQRLISLLRFSERYTQLDMLYVAKGGFWSSFGQTTSAVLSLILIVAFANMLPKETYGIYRYILSLAGVLNIFTLTGMNSSVARAVALGNDGALRVSVWYQLKWNLIMFAAFAAFASYYAFKGDELLSLSFLILGLFVPATLAFNTYGAFLDGKKEFRRNNLYSILSTATYVAGMLVALYISDSVAWLVFAYASTTFAATFVFYLVTLRTFRPPAHTTHREFLSYGKELTFIGFITPIAGQIDKIILAHFWGPTQLAVYAIASSLVDRGTTLIKGWVTLGFPKLALKTAEEIHDTFYLRLCQGFLVGLAAAAGYAVLAPYLFTYLLPQYTDAMEYSRILAISMAFNVPGKYVSIVLESQKLTQLMFTRNVVQLVVQIILYVIFGLWGGVFGLIVAYIVNSAFALLIQITGWHWQRVRPAA